MNPRPFLSPRTMEPVGLNYDQAASLMGCCSKSVWSLVRKGILPHFRVGRRVLIQRSSVDAYMASGGVASLSPKEAA